MDVHGFEDKNRVFQAILITLDIRFFLYRKFYINEKLNSSLICFIMHKPFGNCGMFERSTSFPSFKASMTVSNFYEKNFKKLI